MNKEALIEALKEQLRIILIAVIPITIDGLTTGTLDWHLVVITAIITFLRGLDKYVHEDPNIKANGILPF